MEKQIYVHLYNVYDNFSNYKWILYKLYKNKLELNNHKTWN